MGFFSWMTQDTNKSIANSFSGRETFPVIMKDDKGNAWQENNYEGYGVFGGKDYYELLAEMNGMEGRYQGIDLAHGENTASVVFPSLTENGCWYGGEKPERCPEQGFFYRDAS